MILNIIQIVIALILIADILLQQRGSGLGAAWGGGSEVYHTKRGMEKILHYATIILSIIFLVTAVINFLY